MNRALLLLIVSGSFLVGSLLKAQRPAPDARASRAAAVPPTAAKLIAQPNVLIIAHRGNSSRAPENTLPAFRSAIKAQADLIELDYYHAADGKPIVFHDKTLDRTTDAIQRWKKRKAVLTRYTFPRLRELDAGSWFDKSFRGTRIPSLQDAVKVIQSGSTTLIERKGGDAATIVPLLHRWGYEKHVVLQAFDWGFLEAAHKKDPQLILGALGSKELTAARLAQIRRTGAKIVVWNHKDLTSEAVKRIHQQGYRAWCYTVNTPKDARRVVRFDIDGIITDRPHELRRLGLQRE